MDKKMKNPRQNASAFSEEIALKGFTNQYLVAGELSYKALKSSDFRYIILKDFRADLVDLNATVYATQFDDFIYQSNIGGIEDDFPVLQYQQGNADFVGVDF